MRAKANVEMCESFKWRMLIDSAEGGPPPFSLYGLFLIRLVGSLLRWRETTRARIEEILMLKKGRLRTTHSAKPHTNGPQSIPFFWISHGRKGLFRRGRAPRWACLYKSCRRRLARERDLLRRNEDERESKIKEHALSLSITNRDQ